ncbi:MAG: glycosyltransferase [Lacunisphaera sp.]|nr:glycosyltransferase [Lacunisphaera sp.]
MNPPRKILILTATHLCRNPRVVKEATALGAAGHDVTVLTVSFQERFERMDFELMRGLPFRRLTVDYSAADRATRLRDFVRRAQTRLARSLLETLHLESPSTLGPAGPLLRRARSLPADLTIVHTEIPIWIAQYLLRDGRRVAVDVEDWYSEDLLHADRRGRPVRLLRRAEDFVLNRAVYALATSHSMAEALVAAFHCPRPLVVRNVFPLQPVARTHRPPAEGPPSFIWFSQTIGPGRGLELMMSAWARTTRPSRLFLLGDERPGFCAYLRHRLPAERRGDLQVIPLVTPDQLPGKLAEFDIGLALEPRHPVNRNITITNKLFQYFNAGLAVLATDTAGQREVMRAAPDTGLLVQAHETTQLAAQLDALLGDPGRLRAMQLAARAAAEREFCWEREAPVLLAAVERALAPS